MPLETSPYTNGHTINLSSDPIAIKKKFQYIGHVIVSSYRAYQLVLLVAIRNQSVMQRTHYK